MLPETCHSLAGFSVRSCPFERDRAIEVAAHPKVVVVVDQVEHHAVKCKNWALAHADPASAWAGREGGVHIQVLEERTVDKEDSCLLQKMAGSRWFAVAERATAP